MPELEDRFANERRLKAAIVLLFRDDPEAYLKPGFETRLRDALAGELGATFLEAYVGLADEVGLEVDLESVRRRAEKWAILYSAKIAADIAANLQARLSDALAVDPQFNVGQAIINTAVVIAITEVTRAITQGERELQRKVNRRGAGKLSAFWRSERDSRVCPICSRLDGRPQSQWRGSAASGPPAHVNCRCSVEYRFISFPTEGR